MATVKYPTALVTDADLPRVGDGIDQRTTLTGAHTSVVTTITVASTTGFASTNGTIVIGGEQIYYTGTTSTTFTGCTRGWAGTAAAHNDGDNVVAVPTGKVQDQLVQEVANIESELGISPSGSSATVDARIAAVESGGIAIASQAALDFVYASGASQFGRLPVGTGLQLVRLNSGVTGYEFVSPENVLKSSYYDLDEIATPANPGVNVGRVYAKDDAGTTKLALLDSAGVETLLGGSGVLKQIATTTTPGTTLNVTTTGYDTLVVLIEKLKVGTNGVAVGIQYNGSSNNNYHYHHGDNDSSTATYQGSASNAGTYIELASNMGSNVEGGAWTLWLENQTNFMTRGFGTYIEATTLDPKGGSIVGRATSVTGPLTSVVLVVSSGTISSGVVTIYGWKVA